MLKNWLKPLTSVILLIFAFFLLANSFFTIPQVQAVESDRSPIPANVLANHIDKFFSQGASGFLVWQYSGDLFGQFGGVGKGVVFGNDGNSFFYNSDKNSRDAKICQTLKAKANQYGDKFVGVNIFNAGADQFSSEALKAHFSWLKNDCGVKVIRVFAKEGGANGMSKALQAAQGAGVQLIITVGDYSNGSIGLPTGAGKTWYETEYKKEYKTFAQSIVNAVKGNPALYGLELANEAHCGGQSPDTLIAYTNNWGLEIGNLLRQATGNVGYGQMADPNGICDSPTTGGFKTSNSISPITMTSAHYYTKGNLEASLQALSQSKELGKAFYIGEAGWPEDQSDVSDGESSTTKSANDYITYPLIFNQNLSLSSKDNLKDVIIANLVQDQGYEVQCASPEIWITKTIFGEWKRFFEINPSNSMTPFSIMMGNSGSEDVDLTNGKIAMFRGSEASSLTQKGSSYEGYFGVLSEIPTNYNNQADPVNSGVANSLLTLDQQCALKVNNLLTAKKLCEALENPKECALYTPIANTDFYLYSPNSKQSLLEKYNEMINKEPRLGCKALAEDWQNDYNISQADFNLLKNAIINTPINLDKVYRYAFLVIAPQQDSDDNQMISLACSINDKSDQFWFLGRLPIPGEDCTANYKNISKHQPMFLAFKIPDFGTNRTSELKFKDSAQVTAQAITDTDYQKLMKENSDKAKNDLVTKIQTNQAIHWGGDEIAKMGMAINCSGMPQCVGADGSTIIRQALVDIINGSALSCDSDSWNNSRPTADRYLDDTTKDTPSPLGSVEKAGDISTNANQTVTLKTDFQKQYDFDDFLETPPAQKTAGFDWGIRLTDALAQRLSNPTKPGKENSKNDVRVKIYIVAPLGANLTAIQSSLKSLFDNETFEKMVANNTLPDSGDAQGRIPKYFPFTDAEFGYSSEDVELFKDGTCGCLRPGETWANLSEKRLAEFSECERNCKNKSFGIKLQDNNVGLFHLGAKLGWMIRKIQENLREIGSKSHEYISSCQRVEDLFLGRCVASANEEYNQYPNTNTGESVSSDSMECPMTLPWDDNLVSTVYKNKEDYLLEIRAAFPATLMDNDFFDLVVKESAKYQLNPALILALGREETAWGAVGNIKVLGCLGGGELSSLASKAEILDHQLKCVANNFPTTLSCQEFMCKYSEGKTPPCNFTLNPNFPINLPKVYKNLTK